VTKTCRRLAGPKQSKFASAVENTSYSLFNSRETTEWLLSKLQKFNTHNLVK
jgi:hypothetical protein